MAVAEKGFCTKHPRYKAIRKPVSDCPDCWTHYNAEHGQKDDGLAYEVESPYARRSFTFTGSEYVFTVNGEHVAWPKARWEEVVRLYSADGGNLTQQEIAQKVGANKKVLEACLKAYGHYKARPPVTREELRDALLAGDTQPLMEQAIEVAEHRFQSKLRGERYKDAIRRAEEAEHRLYERGVLVDECRDIVKFLADEFPKAEPRDVAPSVFGCTAIHAPVFDPHLGLRWHPERKWHTSAYGVDVAVEYIKRHGQEVARIARERGGVGTVYLTQGGDILHTIMGRTVGGNFRTTEKPDRLLMRAAFDAFKTQIETVRGDAERTHIAGIAGNHDGPLAEILVDMLAVHYGAAGVDDVVVDTTNSKQAHFLVGDTLHVLDHGDAFSNITSGNSLAVAERIARAVAGEDFYKARRVILYVGHMHHRESARQPEMDATGKSQGHLEIVRVPVMCSENDYEEMLGFWNEPMADVYILKGNGKIKGIERLYFEDETT